MEFGGILRVFVACAACRVPPLLPPYQLTSSPQAFCNTSGYSACGSACVSLPPAQRILFLLTLCVFGNEERELRRSAVPLSLCIAGKKNMSATAWAVSSPRHQGRRR